VRSQREAILGDLQAGLTISPLEALQNYRCMRLAAVIFGLRKSGYDIITDTETNMAGKSYARYRLRRPAAEQPKLPMEGL